MFKTLLASILLSVSTTVCADIWIDEDGEGVLRIDERSVSFFSVGSNYYFDQIFTNVRKNGVEISLCFGFQVPEGGKPTACVRDLKATPATQNKGKVRALHVNTENELFFTILVQGQLREGATVVASIDDSDLYLSYTVNATNKLSEKSATILNQKSDGYRENDIHPTREGI